MRSESTQAQACNDDAPRRESRIQQVDAVLFDMDGVLIESKEAWFYVTADTAAGFGAPEVTRALFDLGWGQGIADDIERFFPGRTEEEVARAYTDAFARHTAHVAFDPAAATVLGALRAAGLATAVVTNSPGELARTILTAGGLTPDLILGADQVEHAKPAPDIVVRACERLGVPASAAVMVGDSRYDREAAAAAAVRFVGLRTAGSWRIEELADLVALVL